jgi:phenylpyruvate tautomerase PptA (4-oxalocrotonate tautomerase family)
MPHVTISLYPGHSQKEKSQLSEKIRDDVIEVLGVDEKFVSVSTREVEARDWRNTIYDREIYSENVELFVKPEYR